jgi:hypothetical protein
MALPRVSQQWGVRISQSVPGRTLAGPSRQTRKGSLGVCCQQPPFPHYPPLPTTHHHQVLSPTGGVAACSSDAMRP